MAHRLKLGLPMRLPGALFVVAWLVCLAPVAAAPVAGEEPAAAPLAVTRVTERGIARIPLSDEGAMVLVGAALIGLAAAVRRAT